MKKKINLYRVVLNMLFYIFYVLLVSIIFSFIFPSILLMLGKDILDPTDPIFEIIQVAIVVLIFIFTLILRKYFYLPIFSSHEKNNELKTDNNIVVEQNQENNILKEKSQNDLNVFSKFDDLKDEGVNIIVNDIDKTEGFKPDIIYNNENYINNNDNIEIVDNFPNLDIKIGKEIK
ncbi:MAG: hypothetical protein Q8K30_02710 [Candidatus Gracilibacteria bacterium]|nr:hypothetical protein [Candidatus Gracilibacteria bacterium]